MIEPVTLLPAFMLYLAFSRDFPFMDLATVFQAMGIAVDLRQAGPLQSSQCHGRGISRRGGSSHSHRQ
jgi:hypothetical protein